MKGTNEKSTRRSFLSKVGLGGAVGAASLLGPTKALSATTKDFQLLGQGSIPAPRRLAEALVPLAGLYRSRGYDLGEVGGGRAIWRVNGRTKTSETAQIMGRKGSSLVLLTADSINGGPIEATSLDQGWSGATLLSTTLSNWSSSKLSKTFELRRAGDRVEMLVPEAPIVHSDELGPVFSLIESQHPDAEPIEESICRFCRDVIIHTKDLGCGLSSIACGGVCLVAAIDPTRRTVIVCAACGFAKDLVCDGDAPKNLGCQVCIAFGLCGCPCGSYC